MDSYSDTLQNDSNSLFTRTDGLPGFQDFKLSACKLFEKPSTKYAFIYINIKKFKLVNDVFGFEIGDFLLDLIMQTLKLYLEHDELATRYIDDRFCLVLRYTSNDRLIKRLEHLFDDVQHAFCFETNRRYSIALHAGVYVPDTNSESLHQIFSKAIYALKDVQSNNTTVNLYSDNIKHRLYNEQVIADKMQNALSSNDFQVYLQPKYDLVNEKIVGAEALARWFDSENNNNLIPNSDYIYIFEQNGFIVKLDMYMLEKSCQLIRNWIDEGVEPVTISVNFSKRNLIDKNFSYNVFKILSKYSVPSKYIEVELTENVMFDNAEILSNLLNEFHANGICVSVDDFGRGYSSLGLLKDLPFDTIKLDKSFFDDCIDFKKGKIIIASIIKMAKDIGMQTLSEGIEIREHIDMLKSFSCDMVQGYYFSKPIPPDDFLRLLKYQRDMLI